MNNEDIEKIDKTRKEIWEALEKYKITKFEATALLEQIKADLVWHSYIKQADGVKEHESFK